MSGLLVILYIWAIIIIVLNVVLLYINLTYHKVIKVQKDKVNNYAKTIEKQTKNEYNKIGTLSYDKLDVYLKLIFAKCLVLSSVTHVSEKVSSKDTDLYAYVITTMVEHIGVEAMDSIEFYYGDRYVYKWAELNYRALENRGLLIDINDKKNINIEAVYKLLQYV